MELMEHQKQAINNMQNGNILWGGVGTGKTITAFGYYFNEEYEQDIYVITTAKKRDSLEWEVTGANLRISTNPEYSLSGEKLTVDSWNNIGKYEDVEGAFFIFDEQRVVGNGAWVKSFLKITKKNRWILLSATPGDTWLDYAPVFIANGFYKNITEFKREHVIYEPYIRFPIVKEYRNVPKLERLRDEILVEMPYARTTERFVNWLDVGYDVKLFGYTFKKRWNVYENRPFKSVAELFYILRRIVNSDPSRLEMVLKLMNCHDRIIIFYTFDYELEILRTLSEYTNVAEYNGHRKQDLPDSEKWVYLVQYRSGSESWNCTSTNAIIFYSLTYSYKSFIQAQGRIDRLDTKYINLYYYVLASLSFVDRAVKLSLQRKQDFNERKFALKAIGIESEVLDDENNVEK